MLRLSSNVSRSLLQAVGWPRRRRWSSLVCPLGARLTAAAPKTPVVEAADDSTARPLVRCFSARPRRMCARGGGVGEVVATSGKRRRSSERATRHSNQAEQLRRCRTIEVRRVNADSRRATSYTISVFNAIGCF